MRLEEPVNYNINSKENAAVGCWFIAVEVNG
jgi:hypothetical protein